MAIHTLRREQLIQCPIDQVFAFFADAGNLQRITPAWLSFQILTPESITMRPGARLDYRLKWHGIPIEWETGILAWNPPYGFTDVQKRGPYRLWHHVHTFLGEHDATRMIDLVTYELPLGGIGELAHALMVRRDLESVFDNRLHVIAGLFPSQAGACR